MNLHISKYLKKTWEIYLYIHTWKYSHMVKKDLRYTADTVKPNRLLQNPYTRCSIEYYVLYVCLKYFWRLGWVWFVHILLRSSDKLSNKMLHKILMHIKWFNLTLKSATAGRGWLCVCVSMHVCKAEAEADAEAWSELRNENGDGRG